MSKQILFDNEFKKIVVGINKTAKAVAGTMGAKGRPVLICEPGQQIVSKDGYTVAKSIVLKDTIENQGAILVRDLTTKSVVDAGDGSTCTTVIFNELINLGIKNIEAGANSIELKSGIEKACKAVVEQLKLMSIPVGDSNEMIRQIATVSANGETEIGDLIADGFKQIGNEGDILIEESRNSVTSIRVDSGYKVDRGFSTPFWVTNREKGICELNKPLILLIEGKVEHWAQVSGILKQLAQAKQKDILIIADIVEAEAQDALISNKIQGVFNCVVVNAPSFGNRRKELMSDIAVLTGGTYITEDFALRVEEMTMKDCGTCDRVIVTKDECTIIGGAGTAEAIAEQNKNIDGLIAQSDSDAEEAMLRIRKGKLNSSFAILSVGGMTELEMNEKKHRIDDAIRATKCAIAEGVVAGGGTALIRCIDAILDIKISRSDEMTGLHILAKAIQAPLRQIAENSGKNGLMQIEKVFEQKGNFGYNVNTDQIEDLVASGIIDATKVIRVALENAVSLANMVLISGCAVVEVG